MNASPRILIFSTAYFPFVGGAEIAVDEITKRIPDARFDLLTARMDARLPKREARGNVSIFRVGFGLPMIDKFLLPVLGLFRALSLHADHPYSAAWAMMASQAGVAAALFKKCRPCVPLVLTLQEGDEEATLRRYLFGVAVHRWVIRTADRISTLSAYLKDRARSAGAVGPVSIIPNGVDFETFRRHEQTAETVRGDSGVKVLITTSRLVEKNAIGDIVEALRLLPERVHFWILGEGAERETLERRVKELRLEKRVRFVGYVDHAQAAKMLSLAHVFVRPSRSEGLGSSFLEAMAMRVPVVATPVGGIPDFLRNGETGLFCKVGDPESIAQQVTRLLEDDPLRARIVAQAYAMVRERFDWEKIALQFWILFSAPLPRCEILFLAPIYPPDVGGPALHAARLVEALRDAGFRVRLLARFKTRLFSLVRILVASLRADVLYANDVTASGIPAWLSRKPSLLRIGGDLVWERAAESGETNLPMREFYARGLHLRSRYYPITKRVLSRAKRVIVPATNLVELYETFYGVPRGRIALIPNPIPVFSPPPLPPRMEKIVLFAGRDVPYKNLDRLARAVARVPGARLERVHGKSHEEVLAHLARASLCVAPALTEFSPNFILECVGAGKPVLVSREHGLSLDLPDACLVDPMDESDLVKKIAGQISHPIIINSPAWGWEEVIREHIKVVKELCES